MALILSLFARLLLALALLAPHGATAAGGGLTLVICGAEGAYEITLPGAPPAGPHADPDACCLACPADLTGSAPAPTAAAAAPVPAAWAHAAGRTAPAPAPGIARPRGPPGPRA